MFVSQQAPGDDKQMRGAGDKTTPRPGDNAAAQTVYSADPKAEAQRLQQALAAQGVAAMVQPQSGGWAVMAALGPDTRIAADRVLMDQGLLPAGPQVHVLFVPKR